MELLLSICSYRMSHMKENHDEAFFVGAGSEGNDTFYTFYLRKKGISLTAMKIFFIPSQNDELPYLICCQDKYIDKIYLQGTNQLIRNKYCKTEFYILKMVLTFILSITGTFIDEIISATVV